MNTTWSDRIKDLEARGWSLKRIADALGASAAAISEIKQGRTKAPTGMVAVELFLLHQSQCGAVEQAANDDDANPPASGSTAKEASDVAG